MKAYFYTPEECGLPEFASGIMRLSGFGAVTDPDEADVFVVPTMMYHAGRKALLDLPYLKGNERRHAMFNVADWYTNVLGIPAMMFRCDCTKWVKEQDPTTIPWPWPVEDLGEWIDRPFKYDVAFQGWVSKELTNTVCDSAHRAGLNTHIQRHNFFYGYRDASAAETQALRRTFLETMATSRLSLVPTSIPNGVVRYRFYEAISMGRVPVHFCDNCVLPLSDRIDWTRCSIAIPESEAEHTGAILTEWLAEHSDDEIRETGRYGRGMWSRWLNSLNWDELFAEIVMGKLGDL